MLRNPGQLHQRNWTKRHEDAINSVFRTPEGREAARQALQTLHQPAAPRPRTPSESGEKFSVPMLSYRNADLWEVFEETHLLQGEWRLLDFSSELSEREFSKPEVGIQGGMFTFTAEERVRFEYFDKIAEQLSFMEYQSNWDQIQLVSWLERNIPEDSIPPDEKAAFLNTAITYLIEGRGFSLEELGLYESQLRAALEEKIKNAKFDAMHLEYQRLLAIPDNFRVSDDLSQYSRKVDIRIISGIRAFKYFPNIFSRRSVTFMRPAKNLNARYSYLQSLRD